MSYPYPPHGAPASPYSHTPSQLPPTGTTEYPDWPYYVVADGIEHTVIQTDIGRWLGNDAVVRKHTYQGVDVYFYKGYRQLTTAMINSLKEDTIKWQNERQAAYPARGPEFHISRTFYDRMQREEAPREQQRPRQPQLDQHIPVPPVPHTYGHPPVTAQYDPRPPYHAPSPPGRDPPRRDPRYAYDQAGRPCYDYATRRSLNIGGDDVPRSFPADAASTGPPPPRYPYTSAPSGESHYFTHANREHGYEGRGSEEE